MNVTTLYMNSNYKLFNIPMTTLVFIQVFPWERPIYNWNTKIGNVICFVLDNTVSWIFLVTEKLVTETTFYK
jgi:hypothetical protein